MILVCDSDRKVDADPLLLDGSDSPGPGEIPMLERYDSSSLAARFVEHVESVLSRGGS